MELYNALYAVKPADIKSRAKAEIQGLQASFLALWERPVFLDAERSSVVKFRQSDEAVSMEQSPLKRASRIICLPASAQAFSL